MMGNKHTHKRCYVPKLNNRWVWANSVGPDQTAPGSALFAMPSASLGSITSW